jgi:hypothetical protein
MQLALASLSNTPACRFKSQRVLPYQEITHRRDERRFI